MKQSIQAILIALILLAALLSPLSASGGALGMRPQGIKVLYYSKGVFEKVLKNRTNPTFARTGDYVKGMRLRGDVDCMTAVNYQSRWMLAANVALVVDIYNPVKRTWVRARCQAVDHQQKRHSTGAVQRLELDYATARRAQFTRDGTTTARIIRVEK